MIMALSNMNLREYKGMADHMVTSYCKIDNYGLSVYVSECIDGHKRDIGRFTWTCPSDGSRSHRSFDNELDCQKDVKDYLAYTYQGIKRKDVKFEEW